MFYYYLYSNYLQLGRRGEGGVSEASVGSDWPLPSPPPQEHPLREHAGQRDRQPLPQDPQAARGGQEREQAQARRQRRLRRTWYGFRLAKKIGQSGC